MLHGGFYPSSEDESVQAAFLKTQSTIIFLPTISAKFQRSKMQGDVNHAKANDVVGIVQGVRSRRVTRWKELPQKKFDARNGFDVSFWSRAVSFEMQCFFVNCDNVLGGPFPMSSMYSVLRSLKEDRIL